MEKSNNKQKSQHGNNTPRATAGKESGMATTAGLSDEESVLQRIPNLRG